MALFLLGLIVFFLPHLATPLARSWRAEAIARLGAGPYKGLYSLVSAVGLLLFVYSWPNADTTPIYAPPASMRYVTQAFMLLSLIAIAAAYLPKGKIAAALQHPMLASVKLWAFGHLLSNGEVRSVILFGAFLSYAVLDRIAVKKRQAATPAAGPARNDVLVVIVAVALWAAIYFFAHRYIAGVALR